MFPVALANLRRRVTASALAPALACVLACVMVLSTGACTRAEPPPAAEPVETAPRTPTQRPETGLALDTSVVAIAGHLRARSRARVKDDVAAVVSDYLDAAFLGDYPRRGFGSAFESFTPGAARRARRDRDLLTYTGAGPRTTQVTAVRKRARITVLAPRNRAAGATAHVTLVFDAERAGGQTTRQRLAGRLLLSPRGRRWEIFGYELHRSAAGAPRRRR